jgi:hypothetical protein
MTERDYILVSALTKLRAARTLVGDAMLPEDAANSEVDRVRVARLLGRIINRLEEGVEKARDESQDIEEKP